MFVLVVVLLLRYNCAWGMTVAFKGREYIEYNLQQGSSQVKTDTLELIFKFRTIDPSGLIFYATSKRPGDFVSLELINGELRYKSKVGFDEFANQEMIVGNNLNTHQWHRVNLTRMGRNVTIELDEERFERQFSKATFERIQLTGNAYFFGVRDQVDLSPHGLTTRKYSGCLRNFMFNSIDVFRNAKYSEPGYQAVGDILWNRCDHHEYKPIMFQSEQDHALIPTTFKNSLSLVLRFRTVIKNGLLFSKISPALNIYLFLSEGKLTLEIDFAKRTENSIKLTLGDNLADGFWHRVEFLINDSQASLQLGEKENNQKKDMNLKQEYPSYQVLFAPNNASLAGGNEEKMGGFIGCLYDIWVDDHDVDYDRLASEYAFGLLKKCELKDHCLFTPCKHGGICTQDFHGFKCDCSFMHYYGDRCQHSFYQPGCQAYRDLGVHEDSYCTIDPDRDTGEVKPFQVLCNMTSDPKKAMTVFPHTRSGTLIPIRDGKMLKNHLLETKLEYDVSDLQLSTIFDQGVVSCKQYVRFVCRNTVLLNTPYKAAVSWRGRHGFKQDYWGDAPKGSDRCSCGVKMSCADRTKVCNCDSNDDVWREDDGHLTDIDSLPIMQLHANVSANKSFLFVGSLVCYFKSDLVKHEGASRKRMIAPCVPATKATTRAPTTQDSRVLSNTSPKVVFTRSPESSVHTGNGKEVNSVNVKVELPATSGDKDGVNLQLGKWALICITVMVVIVAIVIGVVCVVRRCQSQRRHRDDIDDDDDEEEDMVRTEMCTFFGQVTRNNQRPVIEVHRHSIHCDTVDELPPAYRESYGDSYGQQQPITHIDLSYKSRRTGLFC